MYRAHVPAIASVALPRGQRRTRRPANLQVKATRAAPARVRLDRTGVPRSGSRRPGERARSRCAARHGAAHRLSLVRRYQVRAVSATCVGVGATVTIECKAYADKFGLPRCIDGFA